MNTNGKVFWFAVLAVLFTGVVLALYVQRSTTQIQEALAEEVLQQQHDVANLLHEYASVMLALEQLRSAPQDTERLQIEKSLLQAQQQLVEMRSNYSFQRLDGAAIAYSFVRPILDDVGQWLSQGIPGFDKNQPIVAELAAMRLSERYAELRKIAAETDLVATQLISDQSSHLEQFRSSLLMLFAGFSSLIFGTSVLLIRQRNLQSSLVKAQKQHAQRFRDFADAGADLFWESDSSLTLKILSGDSDAMPKSLALRSSVRENVCPDMNSVFNEQTARSPWPVELMERQESFYDVETEWITPAGETHVISFSGKPVLDARSRYLGYRGVGRNITGRKKIERELQRANALLVEAESRGREQAEQALRDSERFHRTILDALPLNIVIVDTQGTIKAVNSAWRDLLLLGELNTPNAGLGLNYRTVYESFSEREQAGIQAVVHRIEEVLRGGSKTLAYDFECQVSDKKYWFAVATTSFEVAQARFTVLVHEDITEQRQLQERDRQLRADLAHVSRLNIAGELGSGLAHELNQPLTAISHNCDALLSIIKESDTPDREMTDIAADIYDQSHRAGDIIRSMRRLIRKESGLQSLVDINELVRETIGLTQADARDKGITITLQLAENLPDPIVDAVQLQQVLVNLGRNAVEAMASGQSANRVLTITTALQDQETLLVSVQDTGPGFDSKIKSNLFSTFVSNKKGGMGLGLSISRTIIEAQGGVIWLDETCQAQTTIRFTIPVNRT
ncbi:MAG: ATP-binding protein [Granulosicoccus sp.]